MAIIFKNLQRSFHVWIVAVAIILRLVVVPNRIGHMSSDEFLQV